MKQHYTYDVYFYVPGKSRDHDKTQVVAQNAGHAIKLAKLAGHRAFFATRTEEGR